MDLCRDETNPLCGPQSGASRFVACNTSCSLTANQETTPPYLPTRDIRALGWLDFSRTRIGVLCMVRIGRWTSCLGAAALLFSTHAFAEPTITRVSTRGWQIGSPQTWIVEGNEFGEGAKIVSEVALDRADVKSVTANRIEFELIPSANTPIGFYPVRIASKTGVSAPVIIAADSLPQIPMTTDLKQLPVAVTGEVAGDQKARMGFRGKSGEMVRIDIEAKRLGANFDPVVRLLDDKGRQVGYGPPTQTLFGDAAVSVSLPRDGAYTIEIHDRLSRVRGPGYFRATIGSGAAAIRVHPLAIQRGSATKLSLIGTNGPFGEAAFDAQQLMPGAKPVVLSSALGIPAPAPVVVVSPFPEAVEAATEGGKPMEIGAAPCGVSGILAAKGETDRYLVSVEPGKKYRLETIARSMGSPIDPSVYVANEQNAGFASLDDSPGAIDPRLEFDVPAGMNKIIVAINDMQQRGGPDFNYRLVVRPVDLPEVFVEIDSDRFNVAANGTRIIPFRVDRRNYAGPVKIDVHGLPPGVTVSGNEVPANAPMGLLAVTNDGSANVVSSSVRLSATAVADGKALATVRGPSRPESQSQPWLRESFAFGAAPVGPIGVEWMGAPDSLPAGGILPVQVAIKRVPETAGKLRLRLLTTQPMPKKTVKVNNQDQQQDDIDRAIRFEGETLFAADAATGNVQVRVPTDLPAGTYDLAVAADLLGPDDKAVITTSYTKSQRLQVVAPYTITFTSAATLDAKAGAGDTGKITGTITRAPGFTGSVKLSLANLPQGVRANPLFIKGDQQAFELPVTFVFGSPVGQFSDVKLLASADLSRRDGNELPQRLSLNVSAGDKPNAEPPLEFFQEDSELMTQVPEGGGQIALESGDKYAGERSLKVTPIQRFAGRIERLGLNIRENPGPGEYRYIRFAWKKKGGANLCLQVGHDNTFGPTSPEKTFRYHAGPGDCGGPVLKIADKAPEGWEVVTRDLFADFGEFNLTSFSFAPLDGEYALFDNIYLGRFAGDFDLIPYQPAQ
jgi:hypothetical protein